MLRRYATIFWDFDGVIKDSVAVKSAAYEQLFAPFGAHLAARVREHHERNGGMSRYEKLPLYLRWAGRDASQGEVERYCELFSTAVFRAVIDSPWVPGAREYLQANHARQFFVLVTATPRTEIQSILSALDLARCFREVYGAPGTKNDAVTSVLARFECPRTDTLLIGDSESDYQAAQTAGVEFLLRRTELNRDLQRKYGGMQCEDFVNG
jgi:phosphoglycolate phosphatase-like HAD superfamily hydrolase